MFPPKIPHVFIKWLTEPGDIVYDPFSGCGTAPLEACRMGRIGFGSDTNPLAYLLTAAKVDAPNPEQVRNRLKKLRTKCIPMNSKTTSDDIRMLYSKKVLGQFTCLRKNLDISRRDDRFIMALLLGVIHANYEPGRPVQGLSINMPRTLSMSPGYVRRYIDKKALMPPEIDVFDLLEKKFNRMQLPSTSSTRGDAWSQDAREPAQSMIDNNPAKLVFTSPPYLNLIKYGDYNWIRLWMLKKDPKSVDQLLVATGSLLRYLDFMKSVISAITSSVREDGYLCLMIGDVRKRETGKIINLAECVWKEATQCLGWKLKGIVVDRLPTQQKVSRIWRDSRGDATKIDRILILSRNSSNPLPPLGPIQWAYSTA